MTDFDPENAGTTSAVAAAGAFDPENVGSPGAPIVAPPAQHDDPKLKEAWESSGPLQRVWLLLGGDARSNDRVLQHQMQNARNVVEAPKSILMNAGGASLGQAIGASGGPLAPATVPIGGFLGGMGGNAVDQLTRPGKEPFKWGEMYGAGVMGAIPGGSLAKATGKQMLKAGAKYAAGNLTAKTVETSVDQNRLPTLGEALIASGSGAVAAPLSAVFDPGSQTAGIAATKQLNAVRDETLALARKAGYKVPPSLVNDSLPNTVLESFGGKAAVEQEMAMANQDVTNDLAKKPFARWGLPQDEALTPDALDAVREKAGQAYERMTALFPDAGPMVFELKQARQEMKFADAQFYKGNPPGDPKAGMASQAARDKAELIESQLEAAAKSAGRPEMVDQMRDARKTIAQTYQVQNALNESTGDVSARIIGSSYRKGAPLTEELATIGRFFNAFKQVAQDRASIPAAGVGKTKGFASLVLSHLGSELGPAGSVAGAVLPFADKIPRAVSGSSLYQNSRFGTPFYGAAREDISGMMARFGTQAAGRQNQALQFLSPQNGQP